MTNAQTATKKHSQNSDKLIRPSEREQKKYVVLPNDDDQERFTYYQVVVGFRDQLSSSSRIVEAFLDYYEACACADAEFDRITSNGGRPARFCPYTVYVEHVNAIRIGEKVYRIKAVAEKAAEKFCKKTQEDSVKSSKSEVL